MFLHHPLATLGCTFMAIALLSPFTFGGEAIYVAPHGNDTNPGTIEKPLRSIPKAIELVTPREGPQEIVIREGIYPGGVIVPPRENPSPLLIRAATRDGMGTYEDVIFDGSIPLENATPVPGKKGVFTCPLKIELRYDYSVWEEDTHVRYASVADERTVALVRGSYTTTKTAVIFHTSDDRSPSEHHIAMASQEMGIEIHRSRVTIRGIQFRHFLLQNKSSGIAVTQSDVTVEECRFWNSNRAVNGGTGAKNLRVIRCRADDVAAGIKTLGMDTIVEDCQFFRKHGWFEVPEYSQDQSGVQVYHPGSRAEVRRTLCVGFQLGVFFKCIPGRFIVEQNTIVTAPHPQTSYGMGCTSWFPKSVFRGNVVVGFSNAVLLGDEKGVVPGAVVDENCLWGPSAATDVNRLAAAGAGRNNINADPLFAALEKDDYRLLPNSPAAKLLAGRPAGAFGIADDKPMRLLPSVKGALDVSSPPKPAPPDVAKPAFIPRSGPPRTWHVNPVSGSDDPPVGTELRPLRSLQIALNHANPGDRVLLAPGVYLGPYHLNHGGTKEMPILIESSIPGEAVLDCMHLYDEANLTLQNAPHVIIRGLEVRWFRVAGIRLDQSPNVTIERCTLWNHHWRRGRSIGEGILADKSPDLVIDHCLLYAMNRPIQLNDSPRFRITHNTITMGLHHGVRFYNSVAGSVFRNNSLAFGGSYLMTIHPGDDLQTFDSDYNNFAANIRADSKRKPEPDEVIQLPTGHFFANVPSKYMISCPTKGHDGLYASLREWQQNTGKDLHSIFKDPKYANPRERDFRLLPDSPNVHAGKGGTHIGALDIKTD